MRATEKPQIIGIDFTSAPSTSKPMTVARTRLQGRKLRLIKSVEDLTDFSAFENFLAESGPRVIAIDFPFGQPSRFVRAIGWDQRWQDYVGKAHELGKAGFVRLLQDYKAGRRSGDKEHRRETDVRAGSLSPMKTHGVPLAKMFIEGAPRLEMSSCSILPCRPRKSDSLVLEAYPGRVARWAIGRRKYKIESKSGDTAERRRSREALVEAIVSDRLSRCYGVAVDLDDEVKAELVSDFKGDRLDALLCAIQAAWAMSSDGFGIPEEANVDEGWITDPYCVER